MIVLSPVTVFSVLLISAILFVVTLGWGLYQRIERLSVERSLIDSEKRCGRLEKRFGRLKKQWKRRGRLLRLTFTKLAVAEKQIDSNEKIRVALNAQIQGLQAETSAQNTMMEYFRSRAEALENKVEQSDVACHDIEAEHNKLVDDFCRQVGTLKTATLNVESYRKELARVRARLEQVGIRLKSARKAQEAVREAATEIHDLRESIS